MALSIEDLTARLRHALPAAADESIAAMASELHRAWSEPQRAYHTLQHLAECLSLFDEVHSSMRQPDVVLLALIFHDAVYEPERPDNEARSAAWARDSLASLGAETELIERVTALVMATQAHAPASDDADPGDTALLLDIDLAILGSTPERFAEYEQQIRVEYGFVPDAQYATARARVMHGFALREPIYQNPMLRERLEAAAHRNLAAFA